MTPIPLMRKHDDAFIFEHHIIQRLLSKPEYQNLPIAIISIAGGFRKGKSFLISHAVAHLKGCQVNSNNDYFTFKRSSERQTEGIDVWDEPFVITKKNGEKVVVLFMDTQGTFDCQTSFRENNLIFGVSATISSLLMYNLMRQIDASDFANLAFFVDFGLAAQSASGHKVYQDLMYVVRDWVNTDDFAYGFEGGSLMLKEYYQNSSPNIKQVIEKIQQAFQSTGAFLCPPPGSRIHEKDFVGRIEELNDQFQNHFKQLIKTLLDGDNVQPKLFNGRPLLCKDAANMMKILFDSLLNAPEPKDLLELTGRNTHEQAKQVALSAFTQKINEIEQNLSNTAPDQLSRLLRDTQEFAIKTFKESPRLGQNLHEKQYLDELRRITDKRSREVLNSHENIMRTKNLETENSALAEQNRELQKKSEQERLLNEEREKEIEKMKVEREEKNKEMERHLNKIKEEQEKQRIEMEEQLQREREESDRQIRNLEENMEEERRRAERQAEENELQRRRMEKEMEMAEQRRNEEMMRMKEEYAQMRYQMEEKAREDEQNFQQQLVMMQQQEQMREQARQAELKRQEEARIKEQQAFERELEEARIREDQRRQEDARARQREMELMRASVVPKKKKRGFLSRVFDTALKIGCFVPGFRMPSLALTALRQLT